MIARTTPACVTAATVYAIVGDIFPDVRRGTAMSVLMYGFSAATIFELLGLDPATEVRDPLNRPLPIAAGQPIAGVMQ